MQMASKLFLATFLAVIFLDFCKGYVITTPRKWPSGGKTQICVSFSKRQQRPDHLALSLKSDSEELLKIRRLKFPRSRDASCKPFRVPLVNITDAMLEVSGILENQNFRFTKNISIIRKLDSFKTYVQTDKYFYSSSHTVNIRILTLEGPFLKVFKGKYPEVWIENPNHSRLKLWKDVQTDGLIHLKYKLPCEPKPGKYLVRVATHYGELIDGFFEVKNYVLPRFEVTLKPPAYILTNTQTLSFEVCADYTFGKRAKGVAKLTITSAGGKKITKQKSLNGCETFSFGVTETKRILTRYVQWLKAEYEVQEDGTKITQSGDPLKINVYNKVLSFSDISRKSYTKPNLPYLAEFKATFPDGSPAPNEIIDICADGVKCLRRHTCADGIFDFVLPPHLLDKTVHIKAIKYPALKNGPMLASELSKTFGKFDSISDSSLTIAIDQRRLECITDDPIRLTVPVWFASINQPILKVTLQIMSRGQVLFTKTTRQIVKDAFEIPINPDQCIEEPKTKANIGEWNLVAILPRNLSPRIKILVWYPGKDGEIVSDFRSVDISECILQDVNFEWSAEQARPGDIADLTIETEGNSICSIGVVDKGVELLRPKDADNDITMSRLMEHIEKFDIKPEEQSLFFDDDVYCGANAKSTTIIDPLNVFNDAGVYVMTDHAIQKCEPEGRSSDGDEYYDYNEIILGPENPFKENEVPIQLPRFYFPETWLWRLIEIPKSGQHIQAYKMPHTLTDWVGKAVCVRPTKGVGISPVASIHTFQDFFIDLHLPPTAKRGETLPVKISVFNYLKEDIPVRIQLLETYDYEILSSPVSGMDKGESVACIATQDKVVRDILIRPKVAGKVLLAIKAYLDYTADLPDCDYTHSDIQREDAVLKQISVKFEGFTKEKTYSDFVCVSEYLTDAEFVTRSKVDWDVVLPPSIVGGSARGFISSVGDLMAVSIENLGGLLRLPTGCGEQNMIAMAPSIYVLQYFDSSEQGSEASKNLAKSYIETGYARELNYRLDDGSYDVFNTAPGSTWLTAFVLRCFAEASEYVTIDSKELTQTTKWLKDLQTPDGCFKDQGRLLHKEMKGGIHSALSPSGLTSFVLIALIEAGESPFYSKYTKNAVECIRRDNTDHPYNLAIKAYALAKAQEPDDAQTAIDTLVNSADYREEVIKWLHGGSYLPKALNLETTGYLVLAMIQLGRIDFVIKYVKSIEQQRNSHGGFYSTQDTVVALQAVTAYQEEMLRILTDLTVDVTMSGALDSIYINESTKLVQQKLDIPSLPTSISVDIEGEGCAKIQASILYNIPKPETSLAFNLRISQTKESCLTRHIKICTSYRLSDPKSNMAMIESEIITGYSVDTTDLDKIVGDGLGSVKRKEINEDKVIFYLDEIPSNEICLQFRIHKKFEIDNAKEAIVSVYDYYNPEDIVSGMYSVPSC